MVFYLCHVFLSFFVADCPARDMMKGPYGGSRVLSNPGRNTGCGLHGSIGGDRPAEGEICRRPQKGTSLSASKGVRLRLRLRLLFCNFNTAVQYMMTWIRLHTSNSTCCLLDTRIIQPSRGVSTCFLLSALYTTLPPLPSPLSDLSLLINTQTLRWIQVHDLRMVTTELLYER